jgi:5-methylcytosine-specific restriction endonuclease McrA
MKKLRHRGVAKAINKRLITDTSVCRICGTREVKLTIDHIIPVSVLKALGVTDIYADEDNFQILCIDCNKLKGDKIDWSDSKAKVLLIKYLSTPEEKIGA